LVTAEVERRTQSVKDKRIAKQESRISSLEDTLAQLKELQADGMSEKQAIQYVKMEEILASQGQQVPTEVPPEGEPAAQPQVAADTVLSSVLNNAGLLDTDADVIAIVSANPKNELAQIKAIIQLAETRKQAQPTPANQAATLPSSSGQAIEGDTLESLSERLTELVDLTVQTQESEAERAEIRAKINKLSPIQK
jgi:uncharacterized coiled-coil protein SlyX